MTRINQFVAAMLLGCLSICPRVSTASPDYPLKKSPNHRYLVDQLNAPVMIVGDSPQALFVNLTTNEAAMFFADRAGYGYNTLWVNLLCATYTGGRADAGTLDGILPFTAMVPSTSSYDLTKPNETYFARADQMIQAGGQEGIQVLLDACETGSFLSVMLDNGSNRCRAYGQFLGARYKDFPNIIWMSGNDFQSWRTASNDAVAHAVALGILDRDTNHLQTTELDYTLSSSLDDSNWDGILGLNGTYSYFPSYAQLWVDYNRPNFLPNILIEANYEFESLLGPVTTAPILRQQEYWAMTSGACGQMYGNHYTWPFSSGWQNNLDTPGAAEIKILQEFFNARAWYDLIPDTHHLIVISNYGTFSDSSHVADNDFLTDAATSDGSLAVVYTPILRQFAVDMSQLSGPLVTRWFDPASGLFTPISGSPFTNNGVRLFAPPGNNSDGDGGWILVLETSPPPDLPLPPPPPIQPKFVQQNYATPQSPQSQVSVSFFNAQAAGNANIIAVGWNDTNAAIASVTDSGGNTYQMATPIFRGNGLSQAIYFAANLKAGSNTVTVEFNMPAAYVDLRANEYSGLLATNPFDVASSASGVSALADSGSVNPQGANDLLFGAGMTANQFSSPGVRFTQRAITVPDADIDEDALALGAGPDNATADLTAGAWLMQVAAFKAAPSPAPTLQLTLTASTTLFFEWSATASGFRLQTSTNIFPADWQQATNQVNFVNGEFQASLSPSSKQQFYRLVFP